MQVFKTKRFAKWAKKEKLTDGALCTAVREMEQGLVHVRLSEYVYKQRVALHSRGKRGGVRTILAFQATEKAFFIFGFAKNTLDNIDKEQLKRLKILASQYINYSQAELQIALHEHELIEVHYHE